MVFSEYLKVIDENAEDFTGVSDALFDNPEISFDEYDSAKTIIKVLEFYGFKVTEGIAGIPMAFKAEYGDGKPSIGILAEYDALDGLNYEAGKTEPVQRTDTTCGHGCGHNLFAGGSVAAAVAVKKFIEDKKCGKITFFGCPGEEGDGGKVFMARAGVFNEIDAVVSWHPEKMHMVRTRPALANVKVDYSFEGVASHAGASPQLGRSALDAAELMNVGVNFLREHMDPTSRIHYAFLDVGGTAPNIVQSTAKLTYLIRANTNEEALELCARVDKIAEGAALMTETKMEKKIFGAYSSLITVPTLQQTGYEVMRDIPVPVPNEEDIEFAKAIRPTLPLSDAELDAPLFADKVLVPAPPKPHGGSTDTADVSRNCPTLQFHIATWAIGTPGHSWQSVAQGKSHFAHEALLYAGKVVAGTALRLITEPELVEKAKEEWKEKGGGNYKCPLPDDIQPDFNVR